MKKGNLRKTEKDEKEGIIGCFNGNGGGIQCGNVRMEKESRKIAGEIYEMDMEIG